MTATPEQVHAICELCYTVLKGTVPSSDAQWDRLQPYEDELCNLIDIKVPFKEKKKIISQPGTGFIDVNSPLLSGLSVILLQKSNTTVAITQLNVAFKGQGLEYECKKEAN